MATGFGGENEQWWMGVQMAGGIDLISKSGDGKCSFVSAPQTGSHVKLVERIIRSSRRSLGATSIPSAASLLSCEVAMSYLEAPSHGRSTPKDHQA